MTSPIAQALSLALLHFIWQGAAVGIVLWVTLLFLRKSPASARYFASCAALAILAVLPAVTMWTLWPRPHTAEFIAGGTWIRAANPLGSALPWLAQVQSWALPVWSLGVLMLSVRLVWAAKQVYKLRRLGTPAGDPVLAAVSALASRMGLRPVHVLISALADGPSVVGWIRPVILLPSATLLGLTTEQLETVLAHELAHVKRYDYLVNVLQMVVETLLFYHPAVWWTSSRIRRERELCCDDLAVGCCGNALCYARALTTLERMRITTPPMAMGSTGGPLGYRILRLVGARNEGQGPSRLAGLAALGVGLICFALNAHWARGQQVPAMPPESHREVAVQADDTGAKQIAELQERLRQAEEQLAQARQQLAAVLTTTDRANEELQNSEKVQVLQKALRDMEDRLKASREEHGDFPEEERARQTTQLLRKEKARLEQQMNEAAEQARTEKLQAAILDLELRRTESGKGYRDSFPEIQALETKLAALELQLSLPNRTVTAIEIDGVSGSVRDALLAALPVHEGDILSTYSIKQLHAVVQQFYEPLKMCIRDSS